MKRRDFLKSLSVVPFLHLLPSTNTTASERQRIVVLVELKGGNDSLNTLIPYQDAAYYQLRPKLAIPQKQVLDLGEGMGMHPAMKPLLPLCMDSGHWCAGTRTSTLPLHLHSYMGNR